MNNLKGVLFILYSLLAYTGYGQIRPKPNIRGNPLKKIEVRIDFDSIRNAKEVRAMPDYDSACHPKLLNGFRGLMSSELETKELETLIPFIRYKITLINSLKSHKKIEIYDKRTLYIDDVYNPVIALLDDSCNVITPKSVYEINALVHKESDLTVADIAFLYLFFNKKEYNPLCFPSNKTFDIFTKKSMVFNTMYSILDYNVALNGRGVDKNYKKLFILNDSTAQFVTGLSRDEYMIIYHSKDYGIKKLITLHFNKDRTINYITKSYFRSFVKNDKYKKNTFYESLESILSDR